MGRSRKFDYQSLIENELTRYPDGLTLDELLQRSELEVDRSTLFRHLTQLIEQGRAQRIGNARASRYRLLANAEKGAGSGFAAATQPATGHNPERLERNLPAAAPDSGDRRAQHGTGADHVRIDGLRHGAVVTKAVRRIVREWKRCDRTNLQIYLSLLVESEQVDEVAAVVESQLAGLHRGNLSRYGLTQADLSGFIPPSSEQAPRA